MARKDSILRLHQRLIEKRNTLRKRFGTSDPGWQNAPQVGGDVGDAANHGSSRELTTQLAALENRELCQIEQALQLIRDGRYGRCERCNYSIPIERLRAVPTTIMCVACQSELELTGGLSSDGEADWGNAVELEGRINPTEVTLRDIDVD
ncbi:MAG: TraR/DksA family transcriptional regulator [Planctomycetaceae bacterium]